MKWLTTVGLASYSIYLIHGPVVTFALARGWNPVVAALLGIVAGFAFFFVAERPFLKGPLRSNLVAQFEEFLPRWFATLGLNRSFHLRVPNVVADHVAGRVGAGHN